MTQPPWPFPFLIAHRGAGQLAPENTLAAFRLGASYGYRMFECDTKVSADGQVYLLHDDTLERTTNATGRSHTLSWQALSIVDAGSWHSTTYAGEPLASLEAVAQFCLHNNFSLNIEIKPNLGLEKITGRAVALAAQKLWGEQSTQLLLTSFDVPALEAAIEVAPDLRYGLLLETLWHDWLATAQTLNLAAIVAAEKLWDAALFRQVINAKLYALTYTVNEQGRLLDLQALGLHGIITDAVHQFTPQTFKPCHP